MKTLIFLLCVLLKLNAAQTEIIIIYTNNTNGILENCKCPDHAFGALEKRATLINKLRLTHKNVILLDSGDIFDILSDTLLHRAVSRAYGKIGYDAWTCGDQDFVEGLDFFYSALHKLPMNFVCSNIKLSTQNSGAGYAIVKKDDIRVGITGTFNPEIFQYLSPSVQPELTLLDQEEILQGVLPQLSTECDYLVLLSHSGFERDKYLAAEFPQIDLIIGSHSQTILEEPVKMDHTLIVQAGESGYRVGTLKLRFKSKKLISATSKLTLLDNNIVDDGDILKLINTYHKDREIRKKERKINE